MIELLCDFERVAVLEVRDAIGVDLRGKNEKKERKDFTYEFVGAGVGAAVHHALGGVHVFVARELEDVGRGLGGIGTDGDVVGVREAHFFRLIREFQAREDLVLDLEGDAELVLDALLDGHAGFF